MKLVSDERDSYQEIANYLGVVERQGRYYRRAAELLEFIVPAGVGWNSSIITELGKEILIADESVRNRILTKQILRIPVIQGVIAMLIGSDSSANKTDLATAIRIWSGTTEIMAKRRLVTVLSWLSTVGLIERDNRDVILIAKPQQLGLLRLSDIELPILPKINDVKLFSAAVRKLKESRFEIRREIQRARRISSGPEHEKLRDLLASRLWTSGSYSLCNDFIDLAARFDQKDYLFEVTISDLRNNYTPSEMFQYLEGDNELESLTAGLVICSDKTEGFERPNEKGRAVIWPSNDGKFSVSPSSNNLPFL